MGHGLVAIPRRTWQESSLEQSIREIERTAVTAWEAKSDAEDEAAVVGGEIASWERMCQGRDDPLANWVRELALRNPDTGGQSVPVDGMRLTEDYLSGLTRRARISHNRLLKAQTHWNGILRRAGYLYDLKSAAGTSGRTIEWKLSQPGRVGRMVPRMLQYVWFLDVLPWLRKGLAAIAGAVSVAIVWSEIVHNWSHPVLSLVGIIIRTTGRHWFILEVYCRCVILIAAAVNVHLTVHGVCDLFKLYAFENFEHVQSDSSTYRSCLNSVLRVLSLSSNVIAPSLHLTLESL